MCRGAGYVLPFTDYLSPINYERFYVLGVGNPLFGGLLDRGCERHAKTAARSAARGKFSATDPVIDCIRRDPETLCDPFYA